MDEGVFDSDLVLALLVIPAFLAGACTAAIGTAAVLHIGRRYHIELVRPRSALLPTAAPAPDAAPLPPDDDFIDMTSIMLSKKY